MTPLYAPVVDRTNMTPEEITKAYADYWNTKQTQKLCLEFMKGRLKQLGYKSMADFRRCNPELMVTAGTITNYFRGFSTIDAETIVRLSLALRMTPNTFLAIMGYYDPKKQTIVEII